MSCWQILWAVILPNMISFIFPLGFFKTQIASDNISNNNNINNTGETEKNPQIKVALECRRTYARTYRACSERILIELRRFSGSKNAVKRELMTTWTQRPPFLGPILSFVWHIPLNSDNLSTTATILGSWWIRLQYQKTL